MVHDLPPTIHMPARHVESCEITINTAIVQDSIYFSGSSSATFAFSVKHGIMGGVLNRLSRKQHPWFSRLKSTDWLLRKNLENQA